MTAPSRWHARGLTLVALGSLPTMAIAALVASLPLMFQQFADVPNREWLVPMILTMPALCVAVFSGPIGLVADRWGRRPVLLVSLAAFALCGALPTLFDSLPAILASRAVVGLGEAGILAAGNALIGDYFEDAERRHWLGIQVTMGPFIGSAYIILGGVLAGVSWKAPFLLYLLGAAVLVAALAFLPEPPRTASSHAASSADRGSATEAPFPWSTAALIGLSTMAAAVVYFLQAVQHGRIFADLGVVSPERISLYVTLASLGTVVGGYLYQRSRPRAVATMMGFSLACYGVAYVGVALAPTAMVGLLLDSLGQFGSGFLFPTLIAWALSRYAFEHRGRGMGLWAACFFLGQFLSPPVMTLIAHGKLSFLQSVGVLGGLCLVAAVLLLVIGRRSPDANPSAVASDAFPDRTA